MATLLRFIVPVATFLFFQPAMAANKIVGSPNGGWDLSTNLQLWASSQSFSTGDTLTFSFAPLHSVIEVAKTDYEACTVTAALQAYTSGSAVVKLNSPGKRYFICGAPGHCTQGMKMEVNTASASTVINPPPPRRSPVIPNPTISSTPPPASPVTPTPTISSPPPRASPVIPTPTISSPPPRASHPKPSISAPPPAAFPVVSTPTISSPPPADIATPPSIQPPTASVAPSKAPTAPAAGGPPIGSIALPPVAETPVMADSPATEAPATPVAQNRNNGRREVVAGTVLVASLLMALVL